MEPLEPSVALVGHSNALEAPASPSVDSAGCSDRSAPADNCSNTSEHDPIATASPDDSVESDLEAADPPPSRSSAGCPFADASEEELAARVDAEEATARGQFNTAFTCYDDDDAVGVRFRTRILWKGLLDALVSGPNAPGDFRPSAHSCLLPRSRLSLTQMRMPDNYLGDQWLARVPILSRGSIYLGGGLRLNMCVSTVNGSGSPPLLSGHLFVDRRRTFEWKADTLPVSERELHVTWSHALDSTALRNILARPCRVRSHCPVSPKLEGAWHLLHRYADLGLHGAEL